MRLERWDAARKKYVLYTDDLQHMRDCERYPFKRIPRRIFLDTNVINCLVKWRVHIFERYVISAEMENTLAIDVEALVHIFHVGARADWDLVGSLTTLDELSRTRDSELRDELCDYGIQVVGSHPEVEDREPVLDLPRQLTALPDIADRKLVAHAIELGCDAFCTCDRHTILNKRGRLGQLPLQILAPAEWWARVKPWAGLWG
jgi:hypothetical protein